MGVKGLEEKLEGDFGVMCFTFHLMIYTTSCASKVLSLRLHLHHHHHHPQFHLKIPLPYHELHLNVFTSEYETDNVHLLNGTKIYGFW